MHALKIKGLQLLSDIGLKKILEIKFQEVGSTTAWEIQNWKYLQWLLKKEHLLKNFSIENSYFYTMQYAQLLNNADTKLHFKLSIILGPRLFRERERYIWDFQNRNELLHILDSSAR